MGSQAYLDLGTSVPIDTIPDLDSLRRKAEQVKGLITPSASRLGAPDDADLASSPSERRERWFRRVEDSVLDLSNAMPEGVEDYDVRKLLELVVDLRRVLEADPDASDPNADVELATMRVADVLQRVQRRLLQDYLDNPQAAGAFVFRALGELSTSEIATLLGVSTKTIGTWRRGGPIKNNIRRLSLVAQLVSYLRHSMTARGVMMWFETQRDQLRGRTPLQLLDDGEPSAHAALLGLARGARAQLAD